MRSAACLLRHVFFIEIPEEQDVSKKFVFETYPVSAKESYRKGDQTPRYTSLISLDRRRTMNQN
jgi:hypothetical protein